MAGYLADLGVTHAYSSPLLRSAEGSNHGYDTVDHAHIDEARGGRDGFDRFVAALHEHGLGLVLDLVPNHMGVADAGGGAVVVGRAAARPRQRARATRSTSTGSSAAARSACRCSARRTTSPKLKVGRRRAALLRATASRSRPGTERGHAAGGARPAALRAGRLAARRHRPELPPVLRDQHPRRAAGRGPGDLRRHPRAGAASWCATARSTGCGSTTRTGWPTRRATWTGWPRRRAAGGRSWRRSSSPARTCPSRWRTAGTTGYDALAEVDEVLVDPAGEAALTALDTELAGRPVDYARARRTTASARSPTASSARRCARLVRVIGELPGDRPAQQTEALAELLAALPGLPQLPARRPRAPRRDGRRRPRAPSRPGRRRSTRCTRVLAQAGTEAATRFEQTSGPVMAKGVEDSAYYRWARFVALNEVGGDPARFGSDGRGVPRRAAAPRGALAARR